MKEFIKKNFLFLLLLISICFLFFKLLNLSSSLEKREIKYYPLKNDFDLKILKNNQIFFDFLKKQYLKEKTQEELVINYLNYFLNKFKINYPSQIKKEIVNALLIGSKYFPEIPIELLMIIISIESNYNLKAISFKCYRKKFCDYGLTQQNIRYISYRYKKAAKILEKENIKYNIKNKFDIHLNILSGYIFLDEILKVFKKYNIPQTFRNLALSYNAGIDGFISLSDIKEYDLLFRYTFFEFYNFQRNLFLNNFLKKNYFISFLTISKILEIKSINS